MANGYVSTARLREDEKKKRRQAAVQAIMQASKSGAAYKAQTPQAAASTVNRITGGTVKPKTPANTIQRNDVTQAQVYGFTDHNRRQPQTAGRTNGGFAGGKGAVQRGGNGYAPVSALQRQDDMRTLGQNMLLWHREDAAGKARREEENRAIRARLGLAYNPRTGVTSDPRTGMNLSVPVQEMRRGSAYRWTQPQAAQATADGIAAIRRQQAEQNMARQTDATDADLSRRRGALATIGHNTMAGLAGVNKGFYDTVDFLLPDVITPEFLQRKIDEAQQNNRDIQQRVNEYNALHGGAAGAFAGNLYQNALGMVPQAVMALMSGGLSTAAGQGAALSSYGRSVIDGVTRELVKNTPLMTSFLSTVGSDYEEAKAQGASDAQAAVSAVISSAINAGIEVGGGLETTVQQPATWKSLLKGAHEEGLEEVKQGIVSGLTQKGIFDTEMPWMTMGGDGVIDPARMAQEYGAGALLGGAAGLPRTVAAGNAAPMQAQETDVQAFTEPLTQTLVKIDGELRAAQSLPEGTIRDRRVDALWEGAADVSRKLSQIERNKAEYNAARMIAERFGARMELRDLGPAGGMYENGVIAINPYTDSPVRQVLVHELTHHLESSGQYAKLQKAALDLFASEQQTDIDALRQGITALYAKNGVTLDTAAGSMPSCKRRRLTCLPASSRPTLTRCGRALLRCMRKTALHWTRRRQTVS